MGSEMCIRDRRHLTLAEDESFFDSKIEHEAKCELTDESDSESEVNKEVENKEEDKADQDFSEYVQAGAIAKPVKDAEQVVLPQQEAHSPPQRITRGAAASRGIEVEDLPLPRHCLASTRGRR